MQNTFMAVQLAQNPFGQTASLRLVSLCFGLLCIKSFAEAMYTRNVHTLQRVDQERADENTNRRQMSCAKHELMIREEIGY